MQRRWPVLAATIPMALGWALAAAHPAAAAGLADPGGQVQPGGPVSQLSQPDGTLPGDTGSGHVFTAGGAPPGLVTPQVSSGQPGTRNKVVSSSNWAGYAASGSNGTFTSASASWTQPAGKCTGGSTYAAFWVGLDGYTSSTVEQVGTEVDCSGRTPHYYAWYEIYPGASVNFPRQVSPGDQFTGSVTAQGGGTFQLVLKDLTKGWTQTASATLNGAALSSAEVIAEAPSSGNRTLPLTNFGTASFTAASANGKSMATFGPDEITMPNTAVSAMTSAGNFSVTYTGSAFPWWFGF